MCAAVESIAASCAAMLSARRLHQSTSLVEEMKDAMASYAGTPSTSAPSSTPLSASASPSIAASTIASRSASTSFSSSFNLQSVSHAGAAHMEIDTDTEEPPVATKTATVTVAEPPAGDKPHLHYQVQVDTMMTASALTTAAPTTVAAGGAVVSAPLPVVTDWDAFEVQLFADQLKQFALAFMPRIDGKPDDLTCLVAKLKRHHTHE